MLLRIPQGREPKTQGEREDCQGRLSASATGVASGLIEKGPRSPERAAEKPIAAGRATAKPWRNCTPVEIVFACSRAANQRLFADYGVKRTIEPESAASPTKNDRFICRNRHGRDVMVGVRRNCARWCG